MRSAWAFTSSSSSSILVPCDSTYNHCTFGNRMVDYVNDVGCNSSRILYPTFSSIIFLGSGLGSRLLLRPMGPGLVSTSPLNSSSIAADADSTLSISSLLLGLLLPSNSLRILSTNQVFVFFLRGAKRTPRSLAASPPNELLHAEQFLAPTKSGPLHCWVSIQ